MRWTSHSLLVALCAALFAWSSALAQDPKEITLQDALAKGLVRIDAISGTSSDGLDYGQPLALATIVGTGASPLQIILPLGSQIQPSNADLSSAGPPLVALGFAQSPLTLAPQASLQVGIVAFSTLVALHPTKTNTYKLEDPTSNPQLIALLQAIKQDGRFIGSNLVDQRAIWETATGADCAATDVSIQNIFGVTLGCQSVDAQSVAALIAGSQAPPTPASPTTSPQSATITPQGGSPTPSSDSSVLLAIFGGIAVLAGLTIAGLFLRSMMTKPPQGQQDNTTGQGTPPPTTPKPIYPSGSSPTNSSSRFDIGPISGIGRRHSGGATQPLDNASRPIALPPTPPVEVPPTTGYQLSQDSSAQPSQAQVQPDAQAKPKRRAAATATLSPVQPAMPEPLCAPALMVAGLTQSAAEPIKILPFTLLTRSDLQQVEILVSDGTVSSPHCMIRFEAQGWTISDLASLNGTLVDGVITTRRSTPLHDAAIIQLGGTKLRFQGNPEGASASLVQIEPAQRPQREYRFNPEDQPYWLLTAKRLRTLEIASAAMVSAPHALITFDDGWMVRDLNSSGGSLLSRGPNGAQQPVGTSPQRILPDDQLRLANQAICQLQALALPPIGAYQPLSWLGQGGAANVFLAYKTGDSSRALLVVKLLTAKTDPARVAFKREAEVLTDLNQGGAKNIVLLREAANDIQLGPYLVFDYVEGATLRALLRSHPNQRLDQGDIISLALGLCAALAPLHQRGWVYCDLKPENVLISRQGEIVLVDFGSVTRINEQPISATSDYAPPEFRNQPCGPATAAADIYSLGAVLYELLTGMRYHHPLAEEPHRQVTRQAITARLDATGAAKTVLLDNNSPFAAIINRCLQPSSGRTQQISILEDEIERARQVLALPNSSANLAALVKQVDAFL